VYVERSLIGPKVPSSGIIRSTHLMRRHLHTGVAIMDGSTWALWGGHAQKPNQRHSCGTRESERCRAASELRAIYLCLEECAEKSTPVTIKVTHPRALAQLHYWTSVATKRELTMPRRYTGSKLRKLARLVHQRRELITVVPVDHADRRHTSVGTAMNREMLKALRLDFANAVVYLETRVPQLSAPLRR
jgi:hypothetical protein